MNAVARPIIFLIALMTVAAISAQTVVSWRLMGSGGPLKLLWVMAAYFTIWINLIVGVSFGRMALTGRIGSAGYHGALMLWIGTVGLIYNTILSGIWAPQGLGWWADQGLHTAVPMLCVVWWLGFAPKSGLTRWHPWRWAVLPLVYCIYALVRGQMSGVYAYPFIDVGVLGARQTALNVVVLTFGFVVAGYGIIGLARILPDQPKPS